MRTSILLPQFSEDVEEVLRRARRAEELGWAGVFVFDQWDRPVLDGPTVLGAVSAVTSRIRVGSLVLRAAARPAWTTAHLAWTVQAMSGGRVVLGLGASDRAADPEFRAYGIPFPARAGRLAAVEETIEALARPELALPGVGRPEVWVGGGSEASRRLAARADGWNLWGGSPARLRTGGERVRELAEGPVTVSWGGKVLLDPTSTRAEPDLVVGDPERVAEELSRYVEAGADELILAPLPGRDPEVLDRLTTEVVPLLGS